MKKNLREYRAQREQLTKMITGAFIDYDKMINAPGVIKMNNLIEQKIDSMNINTWVRNSAINQDPYLAGYAYMGMEVLGIVKWIAQVVSVSNYKRVLFLARDGWIIKQAYDEYRMYNKDLPESVYIYGSRKMLMPAILETKKEFYSPQGMIYDQYSPKTAIRFFWIYSKMSKDNDYRGDGIADVEKHIIKELECAGFNYTRNFEAKEEYCRFVDYFLENYYSAKKHEKYRKKLEQYYAQFNKNDVLFDLGYSARLPRVISKLVGQPLDVLYLYTDEEKSERISKDNEFRIRCFWNVTPQPDTMVREYFISENGPSCIGIECDNGAFKPVLEIEKKDYCYNKTINDIHRGTLEFICDYLNEYGLLDLSFKPQEIAIPFEGLLRFMPVCDRAIFKDTYQEDYYTGKANEWDWKYVYDTLTKPVETSIMKWVSQMQSEIKISVVVTTHNRKYEVARALKGVFAQTVQPYEVIIVDDGSNDGTREYLENLDLGEYKYIYNVQQKGPSRSRNEGIIASNGKYIAFLDSDNEWRDNKIERFFNAIKKNPEADVIYSKYKKHVEFGAIETNIDCVRKDIIFNDEILLHNPVDASSAVYKKTLLDEVGGFSEDFTSNIDWELLLRAADKKTINAEKIDDVLSENWIMSDSISEQTELETKERLSIIEKYEDKIFEKELAGAFYHQYEMDHPELSDINNKRNNFYKYINYKHKWMDAVAVELSSGVKAIEADRNRKNSFYQLLSNWIIAKDKGISIGDVLKIEKVESVAIYGFGKHGRFAYDDLRKSDISVDYIIDKNANSIVCDIKGYTMDDIFPDVDAIIVTPYLYFDAIKKELSEKTNAKIISLEELVRKAAES